ncbi:MAG: OpgC domain-containing protein [Gammaproteobacteria bacterium]|jgi:hypothetical protein
MTTQYQRDREHRVDFLRGLALISMFINHIPGNIFAKITHTNFGFSDAAEVFVTLAGFAAAQAYYPAYASGEDLAATLKAWRRAGLLYFCHIASTIAAIAILAMAAIVFTQPGYLGDLVPPLEFTLTPLFTDPARSYIGIATLGHQLGYFNILPMYMVLLFMLPLIMALTRASLSLLLIASVALWVFAGIFALNMPNYPNLGDWSFNPFAWQLLFVMGFALGVLWRGGRYIKIPTWLVWVALGYLLLALVATRFKLWDLAPALPLPHRLWPWDKTYVSIARLLHLLALMVVVMGTPLWSWLQRIPHSTFIHAIGRNALPIYCWGSLLCVVGIVARSELNAGIAGDIVVVVSHLTVTAALAQLHDRTRKIQMGRGGTRKVVRHAVEPSLPG